MPSTSKEPAFTIIDKRGQNHAAEEAPAQPETHAVISAQATKSWKEVAYKFEVVPTGQGVVVMLLRATGTRGDDKPFVADYLLHPMDANEFEKLEDWKKIAKKRLDTFLGCQCTIAHGNCSVHKLALQQWPKADMRRYEIMNQRPMPGPMEMLARTEMARVRNNIFIPR